MQSADAMHLKNILTLTITLSLFVEGIFAESSNEDEKLSFDISEDGNTSATRDKRYVCCTSRCAPAATNVQSVQYQAVSTRPHPLIPPRYSYSPVVVSNCPPIIRQQAPAVIVVQKPYVRPEWKGWRYGMN